MLEKTDFDQLKVIIRDEVKTAVKEGVAIAIEKGLKPIKKVLNKMQKDLDTTIDYFDRVYLNHEKRIKKVETRLQITETL